MANYKIKKRKVERNINDFIIHKSVFNKEHLCEICKSVKMTNELNMHSKRAKDTSYKLYVCKDCAENYGTHLLTVTGGKSDFGKILTVIIQWDNDFLKQNKRILSGV